MNSKVKEINKSFSLAIALEAVKTERSVVVASFFMMSLRYIIVTYTENWHEQVWSP